MHTDAARVRHGLDPRHPRRQSRRRARVPRRRPGGAPSGPDCRPRTRSSPRSPGRAGAASAGGRSGARGSSARGSPRRRTRPRRPSRRPLRRCRSRRGCDSRGLRVPCGGRILDAKERGTDADVRRALLGDGDGVVLRRAHRELAPARARPRIRAGAANQRARSRASPPRAASSTARGRRTADKPRPRPGGTPPFDPSPARFTWTSAGISSRRAAESVSREWTSSQIRFTTFTLFDCRRPMKCQRKASPYSACFASRSWARFSPTNVDAGFGKHRQVPDRDVLRRGDDRHRRPDLGLHPARMFADLVRREHRSHPGRRVRGRRGGAEEEVGWSRCRDGPARPGRRRLAGSGRSAAVQGRDSPVRQIGVDRAATSGPTW